MALESSSQQPKQITPASNVNLECDKGIIDFSNGIALLEHPNSLYLPMLLFLSNCYISIALAKEPLAYYYEYLREFWYSAKVDSTNTITFTFSDFDKPLSFNLEEFSSITSLKYSENHISIPPKEMVRTGLAILGLFDKKNPKLLSTNLVNSSSLRIRYFSLIWRFYVAYSKMHGRHFFQIPSANEVALIPHMLKVAKTLNVPEETLILPFGGVNADETADKSLFGTIVQSVTQLKASTDKKSKRTKNPSSSGPKTSKIVRESSKKKVAETQPSEESVATTDATKILLWISR
ncbi:hypothetical protein Tco_0932070 [Tanacetum coccineum]